MSFVFYLFAIFTIFSAFCVTSIKNPVYAVLFLILTFVNSAVLFILLGAEFIAMMILIVYIGAVAVLFLFTVMMFDIKLHQSFAKHQILTAILCSTFFFVMCFVFYSSTPSMSINSTIAYNSNNVKAIGNLLYTNYMYAFHISGILLLVAIIGAIVLTLQNQKKEIKKQNVLQQFMRSSSITLVKAESRKGIEWKEE